MEAVPTGPSAEDRSSQAHNLTTPDTYTRLAPIYTGVIPHCKALRVWSGAECRAACRRPRELLSSFTVHSRLAAARKVAMPWISALSNQVGLAGKARDTGFASSLDKTWPEATKLGTSRTPAALAHALCAYNAAWTNRISQQRPVLVHAQSRQQVDVGHCLPFGERPEEIETPLAAHGSPRA
jgi:hypothetical protein